LDEQARFSWLALLRREPMLFLLVTGCGAGVVPLAPGTVGTIVAWGAVMAFALPAWSWLLVAGVAAAAGIWGGNRAERLGSPHDPGWVVIDEMAGYWLCIGLVGSTSMAAAAWAFLWFRLFDILKPPPIGAVERRFRGGWGVMLDDLAAGLLASLCTWATLRLLGL